MDILHDAFCLGPHIRGKNLAGIQDEAIGDKGCGKQEPLVGYAWLLGHRELFPGFFKFFSFFQ